MTTQSLVRFTCDRCGGTEECVLDAFLGALPPGWQRWVGSNLTIEACASCSEQVQALLANEFIHIGHARQSGSGKSWTELGIDNKDDKERWFPVYALGGRVKAAGLNPKNRKR